MDPALPTTTLLVMTLNEIDGMRQIMPRVRKEWVDQILVLDGGSTDGTIEWAREQGYEVYVQKESGFRNAYREAWHLLRGEAVIFFTPDGNSIPEAIPELIEKLGTEYDMVIASRYLENAKSKDDDPITGFGNWLFRTMINLFLNRPGQPRMRDPMVMYRIVLRELPGKLGIDRDEPFERWERWLRTRSDWIPLMSMRALRCGIRWTEIPVDEPPRIGGSRKLQVFRWGAVYLLQLFSEWWSLLRSSRGQAQVRECASR